MSDRKNQAIIDDYDYLGNSASTTDCTGLIPSEPATREEREAYKDVYQYSPKAIVIDKDVEVTD